KEYIKEFLNLGPQLEKCGYVIYKERLFGYKVMYKGRPFVKGHKYTYPNLDVFVMKKMGNKYVLDHKKARNTWPKEVYYEKELFHMTEYPFGDSVINGYRVYYKYLKRMYGKE